MDDISETQRAVGVLMSESVSVLLNLVLVLAAMFWLSWQLSLVALVVVPLFVLPGKVAGKRAQRLLRQEMQLYGELSAMTAERSDVSGRCWPCCTGDRRTTPGCSPARPAGSVI
jgi:ATP-binding cassette, subfamily B, bacterial